MLARKYRLSTREIKNFFNQEYNKKTLDNLKIYYQKNNFNFPKFAVICKKNIFKNAIVRNQIKRKIQEIIYRLMKENKIKNFNFIIVPGSQEFNSEDFFQLAKKIEKALMV